ncbi:MULTISPECIES: glycoside hydrolase family 36 protein [unclassified Paenibacillus]|uniref:glycoside hydrolase family 36 protein n=1 Tax=unclassified Paenibacillus TaxID=185978 RepID=UPI000708CB39|nr:MULTISPECIES: glycoside hydrolase family 36 protein [unclassified Paenibacillus]KQX68338.1 glycoside hydrolase [Paenibacillus sp. Root444D2]KRE32769.1 glycoside hydrolase [Paenibacillus sp. Soil724D2]
MKEEALNNCTLQVGPYHFQLSGCNEQFRGSMTRANVQEGVELIHIRLEGENPQQPPTIELIWHHPGLDIQGSWYPSAYRSKRLRVDWEEGVVSKSTYSAPVFSLYNIQGSNRLTFAFSDALNSVALSAGVNEETATFRCGVKLFFEPSAPMSVYEATLRLDTREIAYYECLDDVQKWWVSLPGYTPALVPESAKLPMYSTWYSFHQQLTSKGIEQECKLAKQLGCEAVIVDDGWQTSDNTRGYAYCGDWEVCEEKIPDMKAHVEGVHQMGLKYLLWYSVPFVGFRSKNWDRFKDKLLKTIDSLQTGVLDPRYPDVREFIINLYETALVEWDLDGFKLDFVDSFVGTEETIYKEDSSMDYISIPEAVDCLMSNIIDRLRLIKPDVMIEFRQNYIGPLMRKYGNMFRATDCPNDAIENRIRTLDVRLISGDTVVHSDMVMWHPQEPVESSALQIVNTLFSVPQISVLLDRLPEEHLQMVRYWLSFWREHRDVLLDGHLKPQHPDFLYPLVIADNGHKRIVCAYGDVTVKPGRNHPEHVLFVNGTLNSRIYVEMEEDWGAKWVEVRDCKGQLITKERLELKAGIHRLDIPPCGVASVYE